MPKVSDNKRASRSLSDQYPGLAEKDVRLITGNLLGVGKKVNETNPKAKHSRKLEGQVRQAYKRLKQKKDKTDAEVQLLDCAKDKHHNLGLARFRKAKAKARK